MSIDIRKLQTFSAKQLLKKAKYVADTSGTKWTASPKPLLNTNWLKADSGAYLSSNYVINVLRSNL